MPRLRRRLHLAAALLAAASACARARTETFVPIDVAYGTVAAEVVDAETGETVPGAAVWATERRAMSRDTLPVLIGVLPGRVTVHADAPGYQPATARVRAAPGDTARPRVALRRAAPVPAPPGIMVVRGRAIHAETGRPLAFVHLLEASSRDRLVVTGADGTYRLEVAVDTLDDRSRLRVMATGLGLIPRLRTVPVRPGEEVTVDFRLEAASIADGARSSPPRAARVAEARVRDADSHGRGAAR